MYRIKNGSAYMGFNTPYVCYGVSGSTRPQGGIPKIWFIGGGAVIAIIIGFVAILCCFKKNHEKR
jgi:hypothetical protein